MKSLAVQMHKKHVHVCCLQETRTTLTGVRKAGNYWRASSPAQDGVYGCEILISHALPFASNKAGAVYVCRDDVSILYADPRRLLVSCSVGCVSFNVVSLHAPYVGCGTEINEWWRETSRVLQKHISDRPIVCGIDSNMSVPEYLSSLAPGLVGNLFFAKQGQHGHDAPFADFIKSNAMCVFSSFAQCVAFESLSRNATYHTRIGHKPEVIDHLMGRGFKVVEHSYHVWRDFASMNNGIDHSPVLCRAEWVGSSCPPSVKRRKVPYDRGKIGDAACDALFKRCIEMCPDIPFQVDVVTHSWAVSACLLNAACLAYPVESEGKHQQYISSSTYRKVKELSNIKKVSLRVCTRIKYAACAFCIRIWFSRIRIKPWCDLFAFNDKNDVRESIVLHCKYEAARIELRSILKLEMLAYVDKICDNIDVDLCMHDVSSQHRGIKSALSLVKRKPRKHLRVCNADGVPSASYHEEREVFRDHFCKVFSGTVKPFARLVDECRRSYLNTMVYDGIDYGHALDNIRTSTQLQLDYGMNKKKNAPGEDLLVPELLRINAGPVAKLMFPLRVKAVVKLSAPLQWRGGMVCELFKGKGCSSACASYRDIMLADANGKTFARHVRHVLIPACKTYIVNTQYGAGMNEGDTSITHLYIKCMIDLALHLDSSLAVLFLDIVTAFASLVRHIVFNIDDGDEMWLASLANAGFDPSEIDTIYKEVCSSLWSSLKANTVSTALAACMYQYTWASTEGLNGVIHTKTGSAAGTPLADLMYVVAMSKVLGKFRSEMDVQGLTSKFVHDGQPVAMHEVGYVDDTAVPVLADSRELVMKTTQVAELAYKIFFRYGMVLNFSAGKSEALPFWRGNHSRLSKLRLFNCGSVSMLRVCNAEVVLRWVQCYKHVGTTIDGSRNENAEVAIRAGIIRSETKVLRKRVLANTRISTPRRINVAQCYIWSKGLHHCGTWGNLSTPMYKRIHAAIMYVYRAILGLRDSMHSNDDEVITALKVMCPQTMLRARRILLFAKAVNNPVLCSIICKLQTVRRTWASTVISDLRWLASFAKFQRCHDLSMEAWIHVVRTEGKAFKREVIAICRSDFANVVTMWARSDAQSKGGGSFFCGQCTKALNTYQALCLHKFKAHGIKCIERLYVEGTRCTICLTEFWTRERVLNHIKYRSQVCRENLLMLPPVITHERADELDAEEMAYISELCRKGKRRHFAAEPCLRAHGPFRPNIVCDPDVASSHHPFGRGRNY